MTSIRRLIKPGDKIMLDWAFHPLMKCIVVGGADDRIQVRITGKVDGYRRGQIVETERQSVVFRDTVHVVRGQYRVRSIPFDCEWDKTPVNCGISEG